MFQRLQHCKWPVSWLEYFTNILTRRCSSNEDHSNAGTADGCSTQCFQRNAVSVDESKHTSYRTIVMLVILLVGFLGNIFLLAKDTAVTHKVTQNPIGKDVAIMTQPCGDTPHTARERGCNFDVISFCWLPDRCYDAKLSEEYAKENRLEWFLDPNRTQPVTHKDIMTGEYTGLYVNWEYHITHCTTMWKKMHRAVLGSHGNRAINGYIGSYEHTKHCEMMLLGNRDLDLNVINTRIAVKYPDCGI